MRYILSVIIIFITVKNSYAQSSETSLPGSKEIPHAFFKQAGAKSQKYLERITSKTEKTLEKLARWEARLKPLIEKASPETAQRLFNDNAISFKKMLEDYKKGRTVAENYKGQYDEYRDKLTTSISYIQKEYTELEAKTGKLKKQVDSLNAAVANTDALQKLIKERKQQLIEQSLKYIGKSKYLQKINKEAYYYVETLRNYKELFSDKKKAEETALTLLNKIPAFEKFMRENSQLASLFRLPGSSISPSGGQGALAGLQTRASVNALIQQQIAAGGPNAREQISQNMQAAQAELNKLKDKVLKAGGSSSDAERPNFKPNTQKSKTFKQRLEFGSTINTVKPNSFLPTAMDIAVTAGYKLNDKSVIGIGGSYKVSFGRIQRINITHQGIGIRSFIDWKLKKQLYISGGYEMNYLPKPFGSLQVSPTGGDLEGAAWQQSGLIGISKKLNIKTKFFNATKMSILYDMLYRTHVPVSQPVVWRVGYNF